MPKKSNLPAVVHDHFRKANILHGYTEKDMSAGTKHALETGQELLSAKAALPHGGWEEACERLFDASLRTAQFYMQFTKNFVALPKAQQSAIMFLECTLEGSAKAAKKAASPKSSSKPPKPKSKPPTPPDILDVHSEPVDPPPADGGTTEDTPEDFPEDETIEGMCQRETSAIESWARQLSKMMGDAQKALADYPTLDELNARTGWERKFKEAMNTLRGTKPVPCPLCDGDNKKCACKGHGRVTKQQYKQMV